MGNPGSWFWTKFLFLLRGESGDSLSLVRKQPGHHLQGPLCGLGHWNPLCLPGPQWAHMGNSPLPTRSPHRARYLDAAGLSTTQIPSKSSLGGSRGSASEPALSGQQLPCLVPPESTGSPWCDEGPIPGRGQPPVIASCRADRPSARPSAQPLARPLSGVQELRMAHPRAVSGEWWVTFEHRYQTVLELSQEIQHCPVRCPQRPRCTFAQSPAAPTGQAGWQWRPSKDPVW